MHSADYLLQGAQRTQMQARKQETRPKMSSPRMNATEKGDNATRPTGRAARAYTAKTLALIGDFINSSTKLKVEITDACSPSFQLKGDSVSERCVICGQSYYNSLQFKDFGRRLAVIGDELMTKRQKAAGCMGIKLAFIILFAVGVYAKLANFELKNSSI